MRSLLITAAVVTAAIALGGCPYHPQQPLPGPQSAAALAPARGAAMHHDTGHGSRRTPAPDPISWFQGTLDEAFSRSPCQYEPSQFRY